MVNYRVADLDAMLVQLRAAGVHVDDKVDETEFGRFGWAMDPEGNRIELWEPLKRELQVGESDSLRQVKAANCRRRR